MVNNMAETDTDKETTAHKDSNLVIKSRLTITEDSIRAG